MSETESLEQVAVIGAGTMGNGIAQVCAQSSLRVRVCDLSAAVLERGKALLVAGADYELGGRLAAPGTSRGQGFTASDGAEVTGA